MKRKLQTLLLNENNSEHKEPPILLGHTGKLNLSFRDKSKSKEHSGCTKAFVRSLITAPFCKSHTYRTDVT